MKTSGSPQKFRRKRIARQKVAQRDDQVVKKKKPFLRRDRQTVAKGKVEGLIVPARGDERTAKPAVTSQLAPSVRRTINHVLQTDPQLYVGPIMAWVTAAAQRGFLSHTENPDKLYWAFVYAVRILLQAVNGTVVTAQQYPRWMHFLCAALAPKSCTFDLGDVSFKAEADTSITPPAIQPVGSVTYGYEWLCYIVGGAGADMFPIAIAPSAYSEEDGQIAFNEVALFMAERSLGAESNANALVPIGSPSGKWGKDVSSFGWATSAQGSGFAGSGGWNWIGNHQCLPLTPMLLPFGKSSSTTPFFDTSRSPSRTTVYSGDTLTTGNAMVQMLPMSHWRMNRKPLVHFIDFLAFGDVLARYVSKLQEQRIKDVAGDAIADPAAYQCPITLQEMLLILRNEMMYVFGNSQTGYQSIMPAGPGAPTDNTFMPFVSGTSTVALAPTAMKLPQIFVENIKSLISRHVNYQKKGKDPQYFVGVLGQYALDTLDKTTYTYEALVDDTPTTIPSFAVNPPVLRRRKMSKGAEEWLPEVEAAISLIDGSSGSDYLFINDQTRLNQLTTLWNSWESGLSAYSSKLMTLSRDLGANIACGVAMTRHWTTPSDTAKARSGEIVDRRFQVRRFLAGPYADRQAVAITSHAPMLAGPWEQILSQWVLPVNQIDGAFAAPDSLAFPRVQDLLKEPYSVTQSATGDQGVFLSTVYDSYASKLVHARDAPTSDLDAFFDQESANGHAGVLSGLVANFLGSAFGPTVGSVAGAVAGVLPI